MKKRIFCALMCVCLLLPASCACESMEEKESSPVQTTAETTVETTTEQTETTTEMTTAAPIVIETRADAYDALFRYIMENGTAEVADTTIRNVYAANATRAITFSDERKTRVETYRYDYFMGASETAETITLIADYAKYYVTITIPAQGDITIEYKQIAKKDGSALTFEGWTTLSEGARFGKSALWDQNIHHKTDIDSEDAIYNTLINLSHFEKYFTEKNIGIVFENLGFTFPDYEFYAMQFIYSR